jgi:hypothetical protein
MVLSLIAGATTIPGIAGAAAGLAAHEVTHVAAVGEYPPIEVAAPTDWLGIAETAHISSGIAEFDAQPSSALDAPGNLGIEKMEIAGVGFDGVDLPDGTMELAAPVALAAAAGPGIRTAVKSHTI